MAVGVGSVYVDVLPSTKSFVRDMRAEILREADAIGRELGDRIGQQAGQAATRPIRQGIEDGLSGADTTGKAANKGRATGDAFGRAMRQEISRALANLPDVEVNLDETGVLQQVAGVREKLRELAKDLTINLEVDTEEAFARIEALKAELNSIRDETTSVRVKYDIDQATKALGELERKIARDVGGAFENTLRDKLHSAIAAMPKIDVSVAAQGAERDLAVILGQLTAMSELADVDLNINGDEALATVERIQAELRALIGNENIDVKIRANAAAVLSQLEAISKLRPKVDVEVETKNLGAWRTALEAAVKSAQTSIPDIEVGVDASLDEKKLARIKAQLSTLAEQIHLGLADEEALAKLRRLEAELRTLSNRHVGIELDSNVDTALAQLRAAIAKAGAEDGDAFASAFKRALQAATANLPDVRPKVDKTEADLAIEQIRKQLSSLTDKRIGIDLDPTAAIAKAEALQALLKSMSDTTIDPQVRMDTAAAAAELAAFIAKAKGEEVVVDVNVRTPNLGAYAQRIRNELEAALRDLPEIDVTANTSPARAQLAALREEFAALNQLDIGVDLSDDEALAGLERLKQELEALSANATELDVKINAQAVLARIAAITAAIKGIPPGDVNIRVDAPNLGATLTKIKTAVEAASKAIADIRVDANTEPALVKMAALKAEADRIVANIRVDSDTATARAELEAVIVLAQRVAAEHPTVRVDADIAAFVAQMEAARAATLGLGSTAASTGAEFSFWRVILAAVLAIFPLIAAAIVALPAAFAAVVTPIAAIVVGLDGIKAAIQPLIAQFNQLQAVVSAVFVAGLQPAVENLSRLFPVLTTGLTGTASALSTVAAQVSAVATSSASLNTIASSFDLINQAVAASAPAIALLTTNLINLTNVGLQGMQGLAGMMQQVGQAWAAVIAQLSTSGVAQAAVQALFQILTQLLALAAPLTQLGASLLAALGPALAAALQIVATVLTVVANGFTLLQSALGPVGPAIATFLAALVVLNVTLAAFGTSLAGGFINGIRSIGPAVAAATSSMGALRAVGSGLFAAIGGPWAIAIAAVVVGLSLLGSAMANSSSSTAAAAAATQGYADALQQTAGVITSATAALVAKRAEETGALASAQQLGISEQQVTDAVLGQNDALLTSLDATAQAGEQAQALAQQNADLGIVTSDLTLQQVQQGQIAAGLAAQIRQLQTEYNNGVNAAQRIAQAQQSVNQALTAGGQAQAAAVFQATAWAKAMDEQAKNTESATAKINAWAAAMASASDAPRSIAAATQTANDAMRALGDAALAGSGHLVQLNGTINTTTQAGSQLQTAVLNAAKGFDQLFGAVLQSTGSYTQAAAAAGQYKAQLEAQLVTLGATPAAAKAVADSLLAIPTQLSTQYDTPGFVEGIAHALNLKVSVNDIPGNKTVLLDAIDDKARATLTALGLQVTTLPNGQVIVGANIDPALAQISVVRDQATGKTVIIPFDANVTQAAAAVDEMTSAHMNDPIELQVTAVNNTAPAIDAAHAAANAPAQMPINGQDNTAGAVGAAHSAANAPANMPINATDNTSGPTSAAHSAANAPAQMPINATDNTAGAVAAAHSAANAPATMPINADPALAQAVLGALVSQVTGTTATMKIDAVSTGAAAILSAFVATVNGTTATMKIDADVGLANAKLQDLVTRASGTTAMIKVDADTAAAEAKLTALAQPRTATLTVNIVTTGTVPTVPNAMGNILPAGFSLFGQGGTMAAGRAQIVPPNTFRVIGDRSDVDEAYIPIDSSARSKALLGITAARMGYALMPMAIGGILTAIGMAGGGLKRKRSSTLDDLADVPSGGQHGIDVPGAALAQLSSLLSGASGQFDAATAQVASTIGQVQGGVGQVVAAIQGLLDNGGVGTQQTGTFLAQPTAAQQRSDAAVLLAQANEKIEQKLDQIATLLARRQQVNAPITVNDTSGNPVETARAMQLAMRLR